MLAIALGLSTPLLLQDAAAELLALEHKLDAASPIRLTATLSRTQALTWESHVAEGTLWIDLESGALRADATVRELRSEDTFAYTLVHADGEYVFVDHTARAYTKGDSAILGGLPSRMLSDFASLLPESPRDLTDHGSPSLGEPLMLGSTRCRTVLAKTTQGPTAHVWYLSEDDGLPRLWETTRELGGGDTLRKRMTVRTIETDAEGAAVLSDGELADYEERAPTQWTDPEAASRGIDTGAFTTLESVAPVREAFNQAKDRPRAIGMFAPT